MEDVPTWLGLDVPTWLGLIGSGVAAATFCFGIFQYRKTRLESRRQFAASAMEKYRSNAHVSAAVQMLDWEERYVWLPMESHKNGGKLVRITHDIVIGALIPHEDKPAQGYTPLELQIRDVFDAFIDELEHLALQARAGAFTIKDIAPYMRYLTELARAEQSQVGIQMSKSLTRYMDRYWGPHIMSFLNQCCPPKV